MQKALWQDLPKAQLISCYTVLFELLSLQRQCHRFDQVIHIRDIHQN